MSVSSPERAMPVLLDWLPHEEDGKVRFQVIRTLERLVRQHPTLPVDRPALDRAIERSVALAFFYLDARLILVDGAEKTKERKTPGYGLLHDLLRDKEANTTGRLFRLLALLHPDDDFGQIYRGLRATKELRATSMELIESVLREPLRSAVAGLADDGDDRSRLGRSGRYHRALGASYDELLRLLATGGSDAVREIACFHAAALGIAIGAGVQGRAA
jgi:hypothetical protein